MLKGWIKAQRSYVGGEARMSDDVIDLSLAAFGFLWLVPAGALAGLVLVALMTVVVARRQDLPTQPRLL